MRNYGNVPPTGGFVLYRREDVTGLRCAFAVGERVYLQARLPRRWAILSVSSEADRETPDAPAGEMTFAGTVGDLDCFELLVPTERTGHRFFRLTAQTATGSIYLIRDREKAVAVESFSDGIGLFHVTVYDQRGFAELPQGIFYQIFTDRFRRAGDPPLHPDSVLNPDWENGIPELPMQRGGHLSNRTVFGGTLDGITERLDYLSSLGVGCIYLTPIFDSPSNHKYDTGDYEKVDVCFGGEDALRRLIAAADEKGIKILLDGVFNHTGADSKYFNKYGNYPTLGAYQSKRSPWYSWYRFRNYPDDYESWWGIDILPRLNTNCEECKEYFTNCDGIVGKYMKMGIVGFRLDVADELPDSFIRALRNAVKRECGDGVLYGEVWEDASDKIAYGERKQYYLGDELDGVMNYPLRSAILDYLLNGNAESMRYLFFELFANTPPPVLHRQMNLLGSHDTARVLTVLGGAKERQSDIHVQAISRLTAQEKERAATLLESAYALTAFLPGVPMIYYGDEAGAEGYEDPLNRFPFPWGHEDGRILDFYRRIGSFRKRESLFVRGNVRLVLCTSQTLCFERYDEKERMLFVFRRGTAGVILRFSEPAEEAFTGECIEKCEVCAGKFGVFRLTQTNRYAVFRRQ